MEIEDQHPIPQQVSSYQFKLVGDMTLQQFFQVAAGALVALLIYSSNLPIYVKYPLILFSFLVGVALAFFPVEDRPLAKWIVLFIKAIYSPTLYVWKKMPAKFSYFQAEPTAVVQPAITTNQPVPIAPTKPASQEGSAKLESEEKKFLDKVSKDLSTQKTQTLPISPTKPVSQSVTTNQTQKAVGSQVDIPKTGKVAIEPQQKPQVTPNQTTVVDNKINKGYTLTPSIGEKTQNAQVAKFSPEAAPPLPPTKPNVVVGQIVDMQGKIVENAILEIRDSDGRPARALRSNKLGHFMIVTPLANGVYQITTEKDGYLFDTINLKVKGEIIPPLSIWAKSKIKDETPEPIKV